MRTSLLLLSLAGATALPAQITIGPDDMPNAGDTIRYRTTAAQNIDLDLTGADLVWDYGDLAIQAEAADTIVSVGSTPFLYQLFFNNIFLYPQNRADHAQKGVSFGFQQLSLQDVFDYYRADADGMFNVGFGASVNGLPTSVRRVPVDRIHAFPMAFGDVDTTVSAFNVTVPTLLTFGQDQVRVNEVDGWGTLVLPGNTFDVLRVKSTLQRSDTIYIDQFGIGFRLPEPETIEYKWYAVGMGKPVLQVVTTGGVPVSARFFYDPDITTSVADRSNLSIDLFPNPAKDEVFVRTPQQGATFIMDALGRRVHTLPTTGMVQRVDLSGFPAGAYTVQIQEAAIRRSVKLIVQP